MFRNNTHALFPLPDNPSHRYHFAPYYVPPPHPAIDQSFASRSSWAFDNSPLDLSYSDPPSASPYQDRRQPHSDFYPDSPTTQLVGYPESSQRTHLHDAAAYTNTGVYSVPFHDTHSIPFRNDTTSSLPHTNPSLLAIDTSRPGPRSDQPSVDRRAAQYDIADQYLGARADFQHTPSAHRPLAHSAFAPEPPTNAGLHAMHPLLHIFPSATPAQPPLLPPDAAQSPPAGPYAPPLRRSARAPTSPGGVPALVYDGDLGEDFDDDSEESPQSAAADLVLAPYGAGAVDGWSRFAFDAPAYGAAPPPQAAPRTGSPGSVSSGGELSPPPSSEGGVSAEKPKAAAHKKSKMHQCTVCFKMFPRPSGLATHMNSHSGAKPYKCPIPTCTKSFAVRSNAKRHLRTHGIYPSAEHATTPSQFTVGFETPLVSEVHEVGRLPPKLRWVPQSLAARTNAERLRAGAPGAESSSGAESSEDDAEYGAHAACPLLPLPLPPAGACAWPAADADEGGSPYLPSQWRGMPGPTIVAAGSF